MSGKLVSRIISGGVLVLVGVFIGTVVLGAATQNIASRQDDVMQRVPSVVVLTNYDVNTIHGTAFYVKATDSVCHLTTNSVLVNGALDCNKATDAQRRRVMQIVDEATPAN